jgi:hypothetical protein
MTDAHGGAEPVLEPAAILGSRDKPGNDEQEE